MFLCYVLVGVIGLFFVVLLNSDISLILFVEICINFLLDKCSLGIMIRVSRESVMKVLFSVQFVDCSVLLIVVDCVVIFLKGLVDINFVI